MIRFIFINRILLLIFLIGLSVVLGYSLSSNQFWRQGKTIKPSSTSVKKPILRIALVADSHSDNENLRKALRQAGGMGINLVIGLGDYTNVGTLEELRQAKQVFEREKVLFVILDNSDIYKGISQEDWEILRKVTEATKEPKEPKVKETSGSSGSYGPSVTSKLTFVFAQKTPFHPDSKHVMGSDSEEVSRQARKLIELLEEKKVGGFFSGDLHFFAQFKSPSGLVKMTTVGAAAKERNFQGPRFAILTVFDDYSFDVEDIEIR